MPRVNRDLQRRMAARRERERRRPPSERRYSFETPDALDTATEPAEDAFDGPPEMMPAAAAAAAGTRAGSAPPRLKGASRTSPRPSPRPFSDYRAEYAYVTSDLRRIVLVMGSLLVILIVLHFALVR